MLLYTLTDEEIQVNELHHDTDAHGLKGTI